jgi:hypothetical protein
MQPLLPLAPAHALSFRLDAAAVAYFPLALAFGPFLNLFAAP